MDEDTHPVPPILYHYTSAEATRSIVTSSHPEHGAGPVLWATSVELMNDASELDLAFQVFQEAFAIEASKALPTEGERLIQFAAQIGRELLKRAPGSGGRNTVCAFSLSEDDDQLGQWRAYCPRTGGYAIGFRSEALQASGFELRRCRYTHPEQLDLFVQLVRDAVSELQGSGTHIIEMVWARLLSLAPCVKHEAFAHEREWRLITGKTFTYDLHVRASESLLLPYREIVLREQGPTAIAEIVVGPQPYQGLAESGLQVLFEKLFGTRWQVRTSKVPYRVLV